MDRLPEIISTVHRRRRWSAPDKIAILEEAFRPGGSVGPRLTGTTFRGR